MRVFLTGGTGFIGQPLTKKLIARGWEVTALARRPDSSQAISLSAMGATCLPGDVTDRESMRLGMAGADLVIHNAAWYELGIEKSDQRQMQAINVGGTDNVLGLALELGIPRTVYVSSVVYYGDTGRTAQEETYQRQAPYYTYYEQSKSEAHHLALAYQERGLPLIIVCPAHVVGPNDHSPYGFYQRLYVNKLLAPFAWAPETVHSPVHVNDVAEGIALAVEKGRLGQTYNLAGDQTSLREIFAIWADHPGGQKVRFYLPIWLAAPLFGLLEPFERRMGLPAFISRDVVDGSRVCFSCTSAKAQAELGWTFIPAREMWASILDEETRLLAARAQRGLVSRLKPVV